MENGDINWIIPGEILAFSSPSGIKRDGALKPQFCVPMFNFNRVRSVVRLNERMYDPSHFEEKGIAVHNLEYPDGSNPTDEIIVSFIDLCKKENANGGAVAVHCRAGLGRTGTLIGLYIMHKFGFTAKQAIAWLRLCRPGTVVGD